MDLKQLQYFVVSVESGSFKKAAEMLYTTQPHISKSIKNLETELNVQLLERKARGVEVTESGKKIYEYACNMLVDASRIHAAVEEIFPSLHHRTFDIGFFYADQRQMIAYLQMIKRKHLEFTALGQTEPILYVGPQNPLYGAESVAERELKSLKYVQIRDFYNRPEMHLMEGGMDYLDYQNQRQVMVTNNRSLLTQIILTTSLANISSARFPDILTGSKDIHAIPIRGMKNRMTFAYVKRLHGDLPEEAKQFVEYVKAHII